MNENQTWLYNDETRQVTYANSERKITELVGKGWKPTGEAYATRWLMDNGYEYIGTDSIKE